MKKALILAVLIVAPTMAFAQGTVALQNQTGLVKTWTSATDSTLISVPRGGGYVELISAPVGTALPNRDIFSFSTLSSFLAANPGWSLPQGNPPATIIGFAAGLFNGGTLTLNGIPGGASAEYMIVGWTGNYPTYEAAYAAKMTGGASALGLSAIATTSTGDPTMTPPMLPVSLRSTFAGLTLAPCLSCRPYYFDRFTEQPTDQTVLVGATATFYVGAIAWLPPHYQWYFNGMSIPGDPWDSSLQISNAQLTNAGTYWAVLSDPQYGGWGVRTSDSATLTVLPAPPTITTLPENQTSVEGSTVYFRASAAGSLPLAYQWFFNTTNSLSGGTGPVLQLTNVQPAQAGAYTVVVTNIAGAVTSPPAMLSAIPPVEQRLVPGLSLLGQPGSLLNLQYSDTLGPSPAWTTLDSVIFTNTAQWYFDVSMPLPPQRFYRAWQTGGSSVIPALNLKLVPALTLTGPVGSSVRVDYINQFGPIDAWVALDTVMLTNSSQLYFDIAASGQPPRLYRLVQVP